LFDFFRTLFSSLSLLYMFCLFFILRKTSLHPCSTVDIVLLLLFCSFSSPARWSYSLH
jgi:hypothetical protein